MSTVQTDKIVHSTGSESTEIDIPSLDQRMAKAWVNFNGTGTVAIRDSYNVSSITDVGAGRYTINFAATMANADYTFSGGTHGAYNGSTSIVIQQEDGGEYTTSALRINCKHGTSAISIDRTYISVQILGGQ